MKAFIVTSKKEKSGASSIWTLLGVFSTVGLAKKELNVIKRTLKEQIRKKKGSVSDVNNWEDELRYNGMTTKIITDPKTQLRNEKYDAEIDAILTEGIAK